VARVIVTGASSHYFDPLLTLLTTTLEVSAAPIDGIVVWDLGLRRSQRSVLDSLDDVEVAALPARRRWPYADWADPPRLRESYAFKPFVLLRTGFPGDTLLWLDAGVAVLGDLTPVFEMTERDGVFLVDNPPHRNDRWTSEECATVMCASKDELLGPQIEANIIGLHVGGRWQAVFEEWLSYATQRSAFVGNREGHRHDQSVLSILAARHGMPVSERARFSWRRDPESARKAGALFLAHRREHRQVRLAPRRRRSRLALRLLLLERAGRALVRGMRGR
jgi:hypothetical protein